MIEEHVNRRTAGLWLCLCAVAAGFFLAPAPAAAQEQETNSEYEYITMKWKDSPRLIEIMEEVKRYLERSDRYKVEGKAKGFVYPNEFKTVQVNFSTDLSLPVRKGASIEEKADAMLRFFETLLEISGFSLVDRTKFYEIVQAPNRLAKPTTIYNQDEAANLPPHDVLVTLLYTFKNFEPQRLLTAITPLLNQQAERISPIPDTRSVLLTAYASKLKELYKVLSIIDQNTSEMVMKFVPLEHALASEIVPTVTQIMRARQQSRARTGGASQSSEAQIIANPRTDREIIALATPEDLEQIEMLAAELDTQMGLGGVTYRTYKIHHRDVSGVKEIIDSLYSERTQILQEQQGDSDGPQAGQPPRPRQQQQQQQQQQPQPQAGAGETTEFSTLAPRAVIDNENNTLHVFAPTARVLQEVDGIVQTLDQPKPQVFLEGIIMELGPDATRALGVELAVGDAAGDNIRGAVGTNMGLSTPDVAEEGGPALTRTPDFPEGSLLGFLFKDQVNKIPVLLRLQAIDNFTEVLAVPRLLTHEIPLDAPDEDAATFVVTRQEPFQQQVTTTSGAVTTTQQFARAETRLAIKPRISRFRPYLRDPQGRIRYDTKGNPIRGEEQHYVRMSITQRLENFVGGATFSGGTPPLTSREAVTEVTVPDRGTVVVGGFTNKTHRKSVRKVPFFGDIPLIRHAFRSETTSNATTTLFIFITPYVVENLETADQLGSEIRSDRELDHLKKQYGRFFLKDPKELQEREQ